jgi:predicted Zn-dependent peptidase
MSYQISTLDNGLRVASESLPNTHSAAFAIAVGVGARHEELAEGGLSHLLEHMAFKGTSKLNARRIAEAFDLMGGNVNAYTSHEHTVYYAKVLKEYGPQALKLLCEIVADSVFDTAELERERDVVLQEIAMHQDSPDDVVFDLFQEAVFDTQPLGRSILGPEAQVAAYTRDHLIAYTEKHYTPSRMVVSAAGAVDHKQVKEIAQQFFGERQLGTRATAPAPATFHTGHRTLEKDLEQVQLVLGYPGLQSTHEDYYALQVFSTILGGGMSSRLFQEIREERGLAYSVSSFASAYQDVGVFGIYAGTTKEKIPSLLEGLKNVLSTIELGVSAAELLRAKNQLKAGIVMTRESSGAIAEWIARHLHVHGRYKTADEILEQIEHITPEHIQRVATTMFHATPAVAALGPVGSVANVNFVQALAA